MVKLISIVAMGTNNVIGVRNTNEMPWRIGEFAQDPFYNGIFRKADMERFKEITGSHPVVMGKNTYLSIPQKYRPLKGRENIVLTSSMPYEEGITILTSFNEVLSYLNQFEQAAFMGGAAIYNAAMPFIDVLEVTRINREFQGDVSFGVISDAVWELQNPEKVEHDLKHQGFAFETYLRRTHQ